MSVIRAVLFDWGNTLVCVRRESDAWRECASAAIDILAGGGVALPADATDTLRSMFVEARAASTIDPDHREVDLGEVVRRWLDQTNGEVFEPLQSRAVDAFWTAWTHCLDILDDSPAVLARLGALGLPLGLVSNVTAPPRYCITQLRRLRMLEHFSTLTFSSALGIRKPQRRLYHDALEQLRRLPGRADLTPDSVIFVGDSPECDITGPAAVGMCTALLVHPDLEPAWPAEDYDRCQPDHHLQRLHELPGLLSGRD